MALCKPCFERARTTTAAIVVKGEWWCTYCFTGDEHPIDAGSRLRRNLRERRDRNRVLRERNRAERKKEKEVELEEELCFDYSSLVVWQQFFYKGRELPKDVVLRTLRAMAREDMQSTELAEKVSMERVLASSSFALAS
jgi:hypothetical protein